MNNNVDFDTALNFVDQQSPASSDETKKRLTKKLLEIMARENEPMERAWDVKSYWK
jgi:hypothetical protein